MGDAGRWKPYVQRQGQLLPAFGDNALDPSDPVFFIDDVVEGLELTAPADAPALGVVCRAGFAGRGTPLA